MVFPELSVTGYTCADLFHQQALLSAAQEALKALVEKTRGYDMLAAVGMPVEADNQLFNCAVVFHSGEILGIVPKTSLPNYNEFYEKRWFASSSGRISDTVSMFGKDVPFGENLLFALSGAPVCVGIEICEDLWMPIPRSSYHAFTARI
jgi:NAD+ synthase (glutamine-hydrolysing)